MPIIGEEVNWAPIARPITATHSDSTPALKLPMISNRTITETPGRNLVRRLKTTEVTNASKFVAIDTQHTDHVTEETPRSVN